MSETTFKKLVTIDCSKHVEKKGKFSYLSWPWAVQMLREAAPDATWEVRRFDGAPYLKSECGVFVEVAVTVGGITLSQIHPVLNGANKPIDNPNAFDINTSIQRCLVKAIALHGLGLYIYAGEDLPPGPEWGTDRIVELLNTIADTKTVEALQKLSETALAEAKEAGDVPAHKQLKAAVVERLAAIKSLREPGQDDEEHRAAA